MRAKTGTCRNAAVSSSTLPGTCRVTIRNVRARAKTPSESPSMRETPPPRQRKSGSPWLARGRGFAGSMAAGI